MRCRELYTSMNLSCLGGRETADEIVIARRRFESKPHSQCIEEFGFARVLAESDASRSCQAIANP